MIKMRIARVAVAPTYAIACAVFVAMAVTFLGGCGSIPAGRSAVDTVEIRGSQGVSASDVESKIATVPSPKLFGLFRGVAYDYEIYDRSVLQRDLARVERYYRGQGYFEARARAGRVIQISPNHVRVEIVVDEGVPSLNRAVRIAGIDAIDPAVAAAVKSAAQDALPAGQRFDESKYKAAQTAILRALTDRAYAYATLKPDCAIDLASHSADYTFSVTPGPPATLGPITIVGLDPDGAGAREQEIPEEPLRRAMALHEGDPYSTAALDEATQALLDLDVLSAVQIVPSLPSPPPPSHVVPLTVKVEPSRTHELRLGVGAEFDVIKTNFHLLGGWEDHNFLGDLRDLSINVQPGAVFYPLRIGNFVAPDHVLAEVRSRIQLKQPGFLEARTNLFLRPELNVYPLLVSANPDPSQPVIGYHEGKVGAGVDRTFGKLFGSFAYNVQVEDPFSYIGQRDSALTTLVVAFPQLITSLDLRDDRVHPHAGAYFSNDLQVAGGPFGGMARDVRVEPEVRTYIPLASKVTFATRASIGLLFPSSYGDIVENHLAEATTVANKPDRIRDIETTFFRGFFSGGPNSNRGFPIRGLAPYGVVPFLNPALAAQQARANCDPNQPGYDPTRCLSPIGGFTLWELSNEARFVISGPFAGAVFCDMGDVSQRTVNFRFDHLHLSCGLGARYDTPVGPIRLDIGYRIQPLQVIGYPTETAAQDHDSTEAAPPKLFGTLPIAVAFGIGEAY
jgi:outer membrane protein insertion porin family/translocation and assembly module TamA